MRFFLSASLLAGLAVDGFAPFAQRKAFFPSSVLFASNEVDADLSKNKVVISSEPTVPPAPPTPEVFRGIKLPEGKVPPSINNEFVSNMINKNYAPRTVFNCQGLVNFPSYKTQPLSAIQDILTQCNFYKEGLFEGLKGVGFNEEEAAGLVAEYKFFGGDNHVQSLIELLKTNPFWTSALTKSEDGGYEVISFDPTGTAEKTRYFNMTNTLTGTGHRVNFYFDENMEFKDFTVFDDEAGAELKVDKSSPAVRDEWATSLMYNMLFYVSCQHATIHVLHYLTTSAFQYVANDNDCPMMAAWADTYANNIQAKYSQVGQLLITDPAPIPAAAVAANDPNAWIASSGFTYALLTGPMGFGSSQLIRKSLTDMLNAWGSNPTAKGWMESMMNLDVDEMKDGTLFLNEFFEQYELILPFAHATSTVLLNEHGGKKAERDLELYLQDCGKFESKIATFDEWVQLMAVTGMVHGSTLSYTRLISDNKVLRWRNRNCPIWDAGDMNLLFGGLGTINGMEPERHVMGGAEFFPQGEAASLLAEAIMKYDEKAQVRKGLYLAEIANSKDFTEFGWIWSDFCPDGVDGKQLTMATYI